MEARDIYPSLVLYSHLLRGGEEKTLLSQGLLLPVLP